MTSGKLGSYASEQLIENKILFSSNTSIILHENRIKEIFKTLKKNILK